MAKDEEFNDEILQEEPERDENRLLRQLLTTMNANMCEMSGSLRALKRGANGDHEADPVAVKSWLKKLSEEQFRDTADKYLRPNNCSHVVVPKVNEEIWGKLTRQVKTKDVKFSRLQTNITKAGHIAVKTADSLLKLSAKADKEFLAELGNLLTLSTDALTILGHARFELSQLRRDDIRPHLNMEYGDLCAASVPVTEWLFGDDLQTKLTHIRAANKIGNTASVSTFNRPNSRFNNRPNNRNFLARAPPTQGRQNWQNNKGKSPFIPRAKQRTDQQQRK
ncbi:uncharacterized protein LOC5515448 [Nematostella vectensis]|uniref:uncharacterized protein LOC5515448 n=1 Tax=Nematostella vectensis TaxID=45351 RepID=UPI001390685F|nr:uncharacterized protein LOC5515448 [Nematostella vectensis]